MAIRQTQPMCICNSELADKLEDKIDDAKFAMVEKIDDVKFAIEEKLDRKDAKIEETKRSVEKGMRYLKDNGVNISAFMFGLMEKLDQIEDKEDDEALVHMHQSCDEHVSDDISGAADGDGPRLVVAARHRKKTSLLFLRNQVSLRFRMTVNSNTWLT